MKHHLQIPGNLSSPSQNWALNLTHNHVLIYVLNAHLSVNLVRKQNLGNQSEKNVHMNTIQSHNNRQLKSECQLIKLHVYVIKTCRNTIKKAATSSDIKLTRLVTKKNRYLSVTKRAITFRVSSWLYTHQCVCYAWNHWWQ